MTRDERLARDEKRLAQETAQNAAWIKAVRSRNCDATVEVPYRYMLQTRYEIHNNDGPISSSNDLAVRTYGADVELAIWVGHAKKDPDMSPRVSIKFSPDQTKDLIAALTKCVEELKEASARKLAFDAFLQQRSDSR
jgi:hypothetical protein